MTQIIKLSKVRIRFCNLFQPKAPNVPGVADAKPRFDASFMIVKGSENDQALKAAINQIAADKWKGNGGKKLQMLSQQNRVQYRDGDIQAAQYPEYEGHMILSATKPGNGPAPVVRDVDGRTTLTGLEGKPYPGCWVNALVQPYYFNKVGGERINCGLIAVQMVREDEAFAGQGYVPTDIDFDDLTVGDSTADANPWD